MTQATTSDKIDAIFNSLLGTVEDLVSKPQAPEEAETGVDADAVGDETIPNPILEAVRILKQLEKDAGDFEDDLMLSIVDRYIQIGELLER